MDDNENLEDGQSEQNSIRIEATMEADRDKFMRRTCPDCGLDFKTLADDNDFVWLLHDQVKRQGYGGMDDNESATIRELCCPYCEAIFDSSKSFTEESENEILFRSTNIHELVFLIFKGLKNIADAQS